MTTKLTSLIGAGLMLLWFMGAAGAATVPRSDEKFIGDVIDSCVKGNEANDDANKKLAPDAARDYCACYGRRIVAVVTDAEYTALISGNRTRSYREKAVQASTACLKKLLDEHK